MVRPAEYYNSQWTIPLPLIHHGALLAPSSSVFRKLSLQTVLAALAVTGVGLGFTGYSLYYKPRPDHRIVDTLNNFRRSLALLGLEASIQPDDGVLLLVARYLAPAATAGFLFTLAYGHWGKLRTVRQLSEMENHTVIIGLGAHGRAFATSCRGDVAALDVDRSIGSDDPRRRDVCCLDGDGREMRPLERVGVAITRNVLIMTGSDAVNLEILERVIACNRNSHEALSIWVRLQNRLLVRQLEREDDFVRRTPGLDVQPFDADRVAAQQLFRAHPLVDLADLRGQRRVHVVVIGWTGFAFAFMEQLARLAPYKDFEAPRVDLLVKHPSEVSSALAALQPAFLTRDAPKVVELVPHDLDDESGVPTPQQMETIERNEPTVTAIVVTLGSDDVSAAAAMTLRERCNIVGRWHAPIFVEINGDSRLTSLLRVTHPDPADRIHPVATIVETCQLEALERSERAARVLHEAYLKTREKLGSDENHPSEQPWPMLAQTYRLANRRAVDHLPIKLLSAGFHVSGFPLHAPGAIALEESEIDRLAALEHRSWEIDRLLLGWTAGPGRDERRRIHDAIGVPYREAGRDAGTADAAIRYRSDRCSHADVGRPGTTGPAGHSHARVPAGTVGPQLRI